MAQTTGENRFTQCHSRLPHGPQGKITDLEQFPTFATEHGHLMQKGMAAQWHETINNHAISKALMRIGFTRKKRAIAIKSAMKRNGKPFSLNCKHTQQNNSFR